MMVLQQTTTYYDGRKPRKLYALIRRNHATGEAEVSEWVNIHYATSSYTRELTRWMKSQVELLNQCPRLENGEASRFYALRYRRPSNMRRVDCCRCGRRFYAYIEPRHQYENRVCPTCVKKLEALND